MVQSVLGNSRLFISGTWMAQSHKKMKIPFFEGFINDFLTRGEYIISNLPDWSDSHDLRILAEKPAVRLAPTCLVVVVVLLWCRGGGLFLQGLCKQFHWSDWWRSVTNRINCTGEKGRTVRQTELLRRCQSKTLRADELRSGWNSHIGETE